MYTCYERRLRQFIGPPIVVRLSVTAAGISPVTNGLKFLGHLAGERERGNGSGARLNLS